MKFVAIDFETFYDDECSVTSLGVESYSRHPRAIVYAAALAWIDTDEDDHPQGEGFLCDGDLTLDQSIMDRLTRLWSGLLAEGYLPVAHNARFEEAFIRNKVGLQNPEDWYDSADAAAYCDQGRALDEVVLNLFNKRISKKARSAAKGKLPVRGTPEWEEMLLYVSDDAVWSVEIMAKCFPYWPKHERLISQMTLKMGIRGMAVDLGLLWGSWETLLKQLRDIEHRLPWRNESTWPMEWRRRFSAKTGKELKPSPLPPVASPKALEQWAEKQGVTLPRSVTGKVVTDRKSDEFRSWLQSRDGQSWDVLELVQDYRSVNRTLSVIEAIENRTVDGRCRYEIKYCGAHTARDSGGGGLNVQNLSRSEVGGVNLRKIFHAPEGKMLAVVDLASIEAVALAYESGNSALYNLYAHGMDLYEAGARALGIYDGPSPMKEHDPEGRTMAKVAILSLGYGTGVEKFISMAELMTGGQLRLSWEESDEIVGLFRNRFNCVCRFWRKLENHVFREPARFVDVALPSGRKLRYYDVDPVERTYRQTRTGHRIHGWGGIFTENYIQALCRDIFMSACLRVARNVPTAEIVLRVHDELVAEVPEDTAEETLHAIERQMSVSPPWYKGCKIGAEGKLVKNYQKI